MPEYWLSIASVALLAYIAAQLTLSLRAVNSSLKEQTEWLEDLSSVAWQTEEHCRFTSEKAAFLERRLDAATCSVSDAMRHVSQRIIEFDPEIGGEQVLASWIHKERDSWLLRSS